MRRYFRCWFRAVVVPGIFLGVLVSGVIGGTGDGDERLLDRVRRRFPRGPLTIVGELQIREPKGIVSSHLNLEIDIQFTPSVVRAEYLVMDAFGRPMEQLSWKRRTGYRPEVRYASGPALTKAAAPDGFDTIGGTDVTWADLALDFIWWPKTKPVGRDLVKGRACRVVDVFPAEDRIAEAGGDVYEKVRLWIDDEVLMILQAEAFGKDDEIKSRLWVKSVKKVDEEWMIKEMEVDRPATPQRTRFRVHRIVVHESE